MRVAHLARKPLSEPTVAKNILAHGTGGINIDSSRIGMEGGTTKANLTPRPRLQTTLSGGHLLNGTNTPVGGRWPANLVLATKDAAEALDKQSGIRPSAYPGNPGAAAKSGGKETLHADNVYQVGVGKISGFSHSDTGGASRYFFQADPTSKE